MDAITRELARLKFVAERDGPEAALAFASQGLQVYRSKLNQRNGRGRKTGYGRAYQRELVSSCVVYRSVLREARKQAVRHAEVEAFCKVYPFLEVQA